MCDIIAAKQIQDHAIYEYLAACRSGRAPAVLDAGELPVFIMVIEDRLSPIFNFVYIKVDFLLAAT